MSVFDEMMCEKDEQISAFQAEVARLTAELKEWRDYWGCESPHDTHVQIGNTRPLDRQLGAEQARANTLENQRDSLKRHLDAIAEALHLGWFQMEDMWICNHCEIALDAPDEHVCRPGKPTYPPDQLPEMVTALRRERDEARETLDRLNRNEEMRDGFAKWRSRE